MFIEFKDVDDANLALATIHNYPFDAKHTFKVNRFTDIQKYAAMDETYTEPELGEYTPKVSLLHPYVA
jgi:translation initiation factor 3 subunit B